MEALYIGAKLPEHGAGSPDTQTPNPPPAPAATASLQPTNRHGAKKRGAAAGDWAQGVPFPLPP